MLSSLTSSNGYAENYTYNDLSLISKKITTIDGTSYSQDYTYDNLSRLQNYSYPYNSSAEFSLQYQYNTISGDLQKIINTNNSDVIWECSTVNALGQISYYKTSNGIIRTDKIYDPVNHLLTGISSSTGGMVNYKQLLEYTYNSKIQMETRSDNINNITETFTYDKNRLSSSLVTGQSIVETTFEDATGNIEYKTNLGDYDYELAQPHAVNKITPHTGENTIVSTDPQVINYTSFNKVNDITEGDYYMDFVYGADHQRIKTELKNSSGNSLIKQKYFIDNLEIEKNADNLYRKLFYIYATTGIVGIYEMKSTGINKMHYVYTDHLGSYNVITDASGNVEEQLSFDAWGRRRNATDWSYTNMSTTFLFDRGFTGHEHLDVFNLINMNGRMYDPLVGRFLSPDNYTQSATTQGLNRYSYCLNNPLAYTDPSGYLAYGAGYNTGQDLAAINHQLQMESNDWYNGLQDMYSTMNYMGGGHFGYFVGFGSAGAPISYSGGPAAGSYTTQSENSRAYSYDSKSGLDQIQERFFNTWQVLNNNGMNTQFYQTGQTGWSIFSSADGLHYASSTQAGSGLSTNQFFGLMKYIYAAITPGITYENGYLIRPLRDDERYIGGTPPIPCFSKFNIKDFKSIGKIFKLFSKAERGSGWVYGSFKSEAKWLSQLANRGWTPEQITEAIKQGKSFDAVNMVNKANTAVRYVHPITGQSVVIDKVTNELLHVGAPGFKY